MKKEQFIRFFFTLYILITISNISLVFGITNSTASLVFNYGGFLFLIMAFISTSPFNYSDSRVTSQFKDNFNLPRFLLLFYFFSFFVSIVNMNYESLFIVLPSLIRCTISMLIFTWLFSLFLVKEKMGIYARIFALILILSASSILVFNLLGIELSYLIYTDLQTPDSEIIGRSSGLFLNANTAAQFALYAIIILLYYLQVMKKNVTNLMVILFFLVICIYSVFLTFSTTGFINLIIVLGYYFYCKYSNKLKFVFHLLLFFILFQGLLFSIISVKDTIYNKYNLPRIQQEKIDNILNILSFGGTKTIEYSYRDQLVDRGFELIQKHPFFGYGAGQFMTGILDGYGIHNTYLQIIGESGIFVFIFYIIVCFNILRRCVRIKNPKINFLLTSGMVSSLLFQLTTHGILYSESMLLVLIMINCVSMYLTHLKNSINNDGNFQLIR